MEFSNIGLDNKLKQLVLTVLYIELGKSLILCPLCAFARLFIFP